MSVGNKAPVFWVGWARVYNVDASFSLNETRCCDEAEIGVCPRTAFEWDSGDAA